MTYSEAVKASENKVTVTSNDGFSGFITRTFVLFGDDWATVKGSNKSKNYCIKDISSK